MKHPAANKIVVIGAGMGGLAAAIRLAAAGQDVTLIEAQAAPGGKMRTLPSEAGPVDAGPTVLTLRSVFDDLFAVAGARLDDHITLIPQDILGRHWWPDGSTLDLFANPQASAAAIAAFAGPQAEAEFHRFHRLSARLYAAFDVPMMQSRRPRIGAAALAMLARPDIWPSLGPRRTLTRQLARSFTDPRLRQLFGRYATYVGGAPDLSPAVLALIWQAEARGVWAVQGGMHRLAQAMAALAVAQGVVVHYGVLATRIERQGGRVIGVELSDGRVLPAQQVVFNGDPAALLAGLLGNGPQGAIPRTAVHPRSLSAHVWAFAAIPQGLPLVHHNVVFGSDPDLEFGPIAAGRMPQDPTLYICAQDRQGGSPQGPPQRPERFEIIMNAAPRTSHSPHEAAQCRTRTFDTLARFGLTFTPHPPDQALTGPAEFAHLFPGSQGSIYGRSPHGSMAAFQRPGARTALPGLYLAGGGAHPGAGVPMAALSGRHAAEAILTDLASGSRSRQMAMPGGISTGSRMTGRAPSR